jgi:hypothetical protein
LSLFDRLAAMRPRTSFWLLWFLAQFIPALLPKLEISSCQQLFEL